MPPTMYRKIKSRYGGQERMESRADKDMFLRTAFSQTAIFNCIHLDENKSIFRRVGNQNLRSRRVRGNTLIFKSNKAKIKCIRDHRDGILRGGRQRKHPLIPFGVKFFLVRISELQDKKYTNNLFVLLKWKIYVNINYRK